MCRDGTGMQYVYYEGISEPQLPILDFKEQTIRMLSSGNRTPGSRFYCDILDT